MSDLSIPTSTSTLNADYKDIFRFSMTAVGRVIQVPSLTICVMRQSFKDLRVWCIKDVFIIGSW